MGLFCKHNYEEVHRVKSNWDRTITITYICKNCLKKKVVVVKI